ncbi:hypothetical protein TMatcc_005609 [Talaromyces marneffei ATCC 18224]
MSNVQASDYHDGLKEPIMEEESHRSRRAAGLAMIHPPLDSFEVRRFDFMHVPKKMFYLRDNNRPRTVDLFNEKNVLALQDQG